MKRLIIILFVLQLTSCSSADKMPKDVFPLNKMKVIIWDMSLADNLASEKYVINKDSQRIMATGLYQKIFRLYKIDKNSFYKSYTYYEAHPQILKELFDSVNAYGMRQKTKIYQKGI
jgi:hypothetical protein